MNYDGPLRDGQMNYDGPPREYPPFERDHHRQQNDGYYQNDLSNPENDNFNGKITFSLDFKTYIVAYILN